MQARFYAGARGQPPPPVCGWVRNFWKVFRFLSPTVFVMTRRGPWARPHRILGLEPHLAIYLAQWTASSHAARNAVLYYRNHSLDGATLFSKLDSNKLRYNVKNEMTFICAKFDADLINISKVTSRKNKVAPVFLAYPVYGVWIMMELAQRLHLDSCAVCGCSHVLAALSFCT